MAMKMTHTGITYGCDARTPNGHKKKRLFRETKMYWIDQYGFKFSKKWDGRGVGDWPMYRLKLDSLQEIAPETPSEAPGRTNDGN